MNRGLSAEVGHELDNNIQLWSERCQVPCKFFDFSAEKFRVDFCLEEGNI